MSRRTYDEGVDAAALSSVSSASGAVLAHRDGLPDFTPAAVLTQARPGLLPLLLVLVPGLLYLYGVRRLTARGDRWPVARTLSFLVGGLGSIAAVTLTGVAAYDESLFAVHMVQHMTLSMVAPVFLALGAPVTLALRTLPRTPRRWLLALLHSRLVAVLSVPPLTFALFVLSPWALYLTSWYDATLTSAYLHEALHLHFVAVGALFLWPVVGVDPVPGRVGFPFRMMLMLLTLPFHAFLGITLMNQTRLVGGDWYSDLAERTGMQWLPDPAADQHLAGGILWGTGDVVGLVFFLVLFAQWVRSSIREAEREDRRLDRADRREQLPERQGSLP